MTKQHRSLALPQNPFDWWTRQQRGLDSQRDRISIFDNDRWCHKYSARREPGAGEDARRFLDLLQLIEVKPQDGEVPFAQRDSLTVVDLILEQATCIEDAKSAARYRAALQRVARMLADPNVTRWQAQAEIHHALTAPDRHPRRRHVAITETRPGRSAEYRYVRWYGAHVLQLSGLCPACSANIRWDGKEITANQLVKILNFDLDPRNPTKAVDTRRHHRAVQNVLPLTLEQQ